MFFDKLTRTRLVAEVRDLILKVLREALEMEQERWVSEKTLREHFELFTPTWLRTYRDVLHPVKFPGTKGMSYPLHEIQRRVHDRSLFADLRKVKGEIIVDAA